LLFKYKVEIHQTEQPTANVTLRLWRHVRVMVS